MLCELSDRTSLLGDTLFERPVTNAHRRGVAIQTGVSLVTRGGRWRRWTAQTVSKTGLLAPNSDRFTGVPAATGIWTELARAAGSSACSLCSSARACARLGSTGEKLPYRTTESLISNMFAGTFGGVDARCRAAEAVSTAIVAGAVSNAVRPASRTADDPGL